MEVSTAIAKRNAEVALMAPPPRPKRIKRAKIVLDEDVYVDAIDYIVKRDFFPALLENDAKQDYLDALDMKDEEWIDDAAKRVKELLDSGYHSRRRYRRRSAAPIVWRSGETPLRGALHTPGSERGATGPRDITGKEISLDMSLLTFQATYTSDDSESFYKKIDESNVRRAEKYPWLYNGNKLPSARQIAQEAQRQRLIDSTKHHDNDSQALLSLRPSQNLSDRPAMIDKVVPVQGPRNGLMFMPDGLDETHPHLPSRAQAAEIASLAPPKSINRDATRFPEPETSNISDLDPTSAPASPTLSAIDAAIRGQPRHRTTSTIAPSEADPNDSIPLVNGYAFVNPYPSPAETAAHRHHTLNSAASSPAKSKKSHDHLALLTQLLQNPDGTTDTTPNPFTINDPGKRDLVADRLIQRHLASNRETSWTGDARLARLRTAATPAATPKFPSATPKFASSPRIDPSVTAAVRPAGATPRMTPGGRRGVRDVASMTPAQQRLMANLRTPSRLGTAPWGIGAAVVDGAAFGVPDARGEKKTLWTPKKAQSRSRTDG